MKHDWEYKKLGECFSYIKNGANIKQDKSHIGYPITRIETLSNGVFNRDKVGYAGITELGKYQTNVLGDKDLLMSHINSKDYIGRTVVYDKQGDEQIIHGMNLLRLIPTDILISDYFQYYTLSPAFKECVARIRKDAVNQSSFAISDLVRINIPVPPLPIQQQIVAELDKVSEIIEKKKQQVKELDYLAQSIFYDMFGDPVENEMGWEVKNLGEECSELRYGTSRPAVDGGKYGYLRMGNLTITGHLDLSNLKYIDIPEDEIEKCLVRKGDVLFNRTNSLDLIGKTCMFDLDEPMVIAGYIIRVRLKPTLHPRYVVSLFNTQVMKKVLRKMAKGAVNQANINSKELSSIIIPIPPLPLQQTFAQKVEAIEKQKELITSSIKEAQTLFDARMDYWFGE